MSKAKKIARRRKQRQYIEKNFLNNDTHKEELIKELLGCEDSCQLCGGELLLALSSYDLIKGEKDVYSCLKCGAEQSVLFPKGSNS